MGAILSSSRHVEPADDAPRKKRVLVVGAGAAGTAAAWSLSRHNDKFDVAVWEVLDVPGGVASSCRVGEEGGESRERGRRRGCLQRRRRRITHDANTAV